MTTTGSANPIQNITISLNVPTEPPILDLVDHSRAVGQEPERTDDPLDVLAVAPFANGADLEAPGLPLPRGLAGAA